MSAKKARRERTASPAQRTSQQAAGSSALPNAADVVAPSAWIASTDPRRRRIGQIVLVVVWLYVAALWLLALDQWLHWGIFGPKLPPV